MENRLPQYALALFDLDGYTVVIDTKKLHSKGKITKGKELEFNHCKEIYKVEVLEFSDSKCKLNKFEDEWSTSDRSKALDIAKKERDDYGGFLSVSPSDNEDEDVEVIGVENQGHMDIVVVADEVLQADAAQVNNENSITDATTETKQESQTATKKKVETTTKELQAADHHSGKKTSSTQTDEVVVISANDDPRTLLFSKESKRVGTQCDFQSEELASSKIDRLEAKSTKILTVLSGITNDKLDPMLSILRCVIPSIMEFDMDNVLNNLPDLSPEATSEIPLSTVPSTKDQSPASVPIPPPSAYKTATLAPVPGPSTDYSRTSVTIPGPSTTDKTATLVPVPGPSTTDKTATIVLPPGPSTTDETATLVLSPGPSTDRTPNSLPVPGPSTEQTPTTFLTSASVNHAHYDPTSTLLPTTFMTISQPTEILTLSPTETTPTGPTTFRRRTPLFRNCYEGSLVEIDCFPDMTDIPNDAEVRVRQSLINSTLNSACSTGNFAWTLAQRLFQEEGLLGRNYRGKRGEAALSPRRTHAIEHCVVACYGYTENNLGETRRAINTGIRKNSYDKL